MTDRANDLEQGFKKTVSVIIPHYNDLVGLRNCCTQLAKQTWPTNDLEIIIADNRSQCGIEAVQAAAPGAHVVSAPIQGAGPARNVGVSASSGKILAFLDSDCVPHQDWITEGVAALRHYDFIGGQVVTTPSDPERPNNIESFECVFNFNFRRYIEQVGFTGTGNMFVPRRVFNHVGGFHTGVAEDMDWSFRARRFGYTLGYAEHAIVSHPARRTWKSLEARWARMEAEHFQLVRKQRFGHIFYLMKAIGMPLSIIPHVGKVLSTTRLKTTRARIGAISVLVRLRLWRAAEMMRLAVGDITWRGSSR
jgi:GT2 family glycosyltransferase